METTPFVVVDVCYISFLSLLINANCQPLDHHLLLSISLQLQFRFMKSWQHDIKMKLDFLKLQSKFGFFAFCFLELTERMPENQRKFYQECSLNRTENELVTVQLPKSLLTTIDTLK